MLLFTLLASITAQDAVLERYIKSGLENNLALKQKEFSLQKSIASLDDARGMFMPSVSINARYTRAGGGRTIDFPVGDLVNPIYGGLNQLLGSNVYPTDIANEEINFLRKKEHETKISLVQPIFQPQIYFNYKLNNNLVEIKKAEKEVYARELIAEIRKAYYNYRKTLQVVDLFHETEELLTENLRVSKSLFNNDKVTKDVVYRAEAELSDIIQRKSEAEKNQELARNYFNFLLNRSLDSTIEESDEADGEANEELTLGVVIKNALNQREEFKQVSSAIKVADNTIGLANSNNYPSLILAADYGFQGEEYNFDKESDYWMASLVLQWNLFNGFRDKAKTEQAQYEKQRLEAQQLELQKRIVLQMTESFREFELSRQSLSTARLREVSSEEAFKIIDRKFKEGIASQIEFIDARTSLTQSKVNRIVTEYEVKIKETEMLKNSVLDPMALSYNSESKGELK